VYCCEFDDKNTIIELNHCSNMRNVVVHDRQPCLCPLSTIEVETLHNCVRHCFPISILTPANSHSAIYNPPFANGTGATEECAAGRLIKASIMLIESDVWFYSSRCAATVQQLHVPARGQCCSEVRFHRLVQALWWQLVRYAGLHGSVWSQASSTSTG